MSETIIPIFMFLVLIAAFIANQSAETIAVLYAGLMIAIAISNKK